MFAHDDEDAGFAVEEDGSGGVDGDCGDIRRFFKMASDGGAVQGSDVHGGELGVDVVAHGLAHGFFAHSVGAVGVGVVEIEVGGWRALADIVAGRAAFEAQGVQVGGVVRVEREGG